MKIFEIPIRLAIAVTIFLGRRFIYAAFRPQITLPNGQCVKKMNLKEPSIVIANHTSTLDPILLLAVIRSPRNIVVAKDWYDMKKFHWILSRTAIPCDRFNLDTEWALLAKKEIQKGKSVIIFPEGKTRTDGKLNEFKSGFAFLARSTKTPVVSIGIDGSYKVGTPMHLIVSEGEFIERSKEIPSSEYLAQKSDYFRQKVCQLKSLALKKTAKTGAKN